METSECSNSMRRIRVVAKLKGMPARESGISGSDPAKPWIFVDKKNEDSSRTVKITFGEQSSGSKESYELDYCYQQNEDNIDFYTREINFLMSGVFEGHNSTVIAYGAKGSGKTSLIRGFREKPGLAVLAMADFLVMAEEKGKTVSISFYEVYVDHVYDLLDVKRPPVLLLDDGRGNIQLKGLSRVRVNSIAEFHKLYFSGSSRKPRQNMTAERSHKGLIIYFSLANESFDTRDAKMNFVDLAGYEDARRESRDALNFMDISKVNKSIYVLMNVLHCLNSNERRIPYRESKLTRMLQDSLEANCKIVVVACLNTYFCQDSIHMVSLGSRLCQGNDRDISGLTPKVKALARNLELSQIPGSVGVHGKKQNISRIVHSEKKQIVYSKMATPMRIRKLFVSGCDLQNSNKVAEEFTSNEISSIEESCIVGEDSHLDDSAADNFSRRIDESFIVGEDSNLDDLTDFSCGMSNNKEEVVQMVKESASSQIKEPGSPPLSAMLRNIADEMRSFLLSKNALPISETPSSSIGFVEYQAPLQKEHIIGNDGHDTSFFNSPWDRFGSRNKGVQNSLVEDYLKILNTANKEELMKLKGIGDKRANAIIEFRDASPEPFKSLDDLKEIGLSEKQIKGMMKKEMGGLFN